MLQAFGLAVDATPQDCSWRGSVLTQATGETHCSESCFPWDAFDLALPLSPSAYGYSRGFTWMDQGKLPLPSPLMCHEEAQTLEPGQRELGSRKGPKLHIRTENLLPFLKFIIGLVCLFHTRRFIILTSY